MKLLLGILLVFLVQFSFAQTAGSINHRRAVKERLTLDALAKELTASSSTDLHKVNAIFHWITGNISYKTYTYQSRFIASRYRAQAQAEEDSLASLDEMVAQTVIRNGEAVCDGYARLFKALCDKAGIRSEIITGYARGGGNTSFRSNHKWNAVFVDSNWHLVDATWASGYVTFSNQFVRSYDPTYFMPPPQNFIKDHYPEDIRWTLLTEPPTLREFYHAPFKLTGFVTNKITSYQPGNGIIEASVGDSILVELETDNPKEKLFVTDNPMPEFAIINNQWNPSTSKAFISGKKITYTYTVPSATVQWLSVIYNDEVVLRYKLKIRERQAEEKALN